MSDIFGYKNIEDFMTSHLDYLVVEWLKIKDSGYSLSAFPYVLLNYNGLEEFYRYFFYTKAVYLDYDRGFCISKCS